MSARRRTLLWLPIAFAAGCGGSSPSGPGPIPTPTPAPGDVHDVTVLVFYDENANGAVDGFEGVRLGDVEVLVGSRKGVTERGTGLALVSGVPAGMTSASLRSATLPAYFVPGPAVDTQVPPSKNQPVLLPVTLPIGLNRANRYLAFGDSITSGDGSSDGNGYREKLLAELESRWGGAPVIINEGKGATRTLAGALRIAGTVAERRPAYTLILYGTNDWNECKGLVPCSTVGNLQLMIESAKSAQSHPILATIIPSNPDFPDQVPPERNVWVHEIDALLHDLAQQEDVPLADLEAAFLAEPNLPDLFADHIHPNDRGYDLIAEGFLKAITGPRGGAGGTGLAVLPNFGFTGGPPSGERTD